MKENPQISSVGNASVSFALEAFYRSYVEKITIDIVEIHYTGWRKGSDDKFASSIDDLYVGFLLFLSLT